MKLCLLLLLVATPATAWVPNNNDVALVLGQRHQQRTAATALDMAAVGIFYGTSTGSTQEVASAIYKAFGKDVAAKPVDVDTIDMDLATVFGQHDALVVGTPTWNTGADTERSGTGWDELYYKQLPSIRQVLQGKKVAVFGLGDQVSYSDNYADATGELFDVFEGLGCHMLGAWSQEGYEHEASKSIRGDMFCGLILDAVNQEDLTPERVEKWVAQLISEGILEEGAVAGSERGKPATPKLAAKTKQFDKLEEHSDLLDQSIDSHSSGGFTPHHNVAKGTTMWTSPDGRSSFVTEIKATAKTTKFAP